MNIFLIIFAVFLVTAFAVMIYHLAHAPVGEETPEGFAETSLLRANWGLEANRSVVRSTCRQRSAPPSLLKSPR
jgi:hypothetical protein